MRAHLSYLRYVVLHKWYVFQAGLRVGVPLWRLLIHDWTKFLPAEWSPYVHAFYRVDGRRKPLVERTAVEREVFERAWLHHLNRNPHHWQYWLLREDCGCERMLRMPEHFVREMVADWWGAGKAITGKNDLVEWYERNRVVIQLHPDTRKRVEELIAILG